MRSNVTYRADIDGLRAFAVLFVTVFHINEALIPGGFVGVDMFFVISGFLITGIIVRDRANGQFSYAEFYRRRIRRIFPAMFLVTAATLLSGMLLMVPEDVIALSWSALATIFSAANVYFTYFLDTSYFAPDSAAVPLLHMWSLGVEEQFYVVWPATLIVLLRWPKLVVPALLAVVCASVVCGEWLLAEESFEHAYYMLPARAFQLATGGLLVFLMPLLAAAGRRMGLLLAAAGGALCVGSVAFLDGATAYPGLNALPVTFGTAMLIAAGGLPNPVSQALSLAPLRAIGLISYSLYLWHWPVLAFQRYFHPDLSVPQQILSFILMLGLAWLSYRYVEIPARHSQRALPQMAMRMAVLPCLGIGLLLGILAATRGFGPWALTDYPDRLSALGGNPEPASRAPYVCQSSLVTDAMLADPRCAVSAGDTGEVDILLWGDSNAAHYVGTLRALTETAGFGFRNIAHSACPPLLRQPERFAQERRRSNCRDSAQAVYRQLDRYERVILSSAWDTGLSRDGYAEELEHTVKRLVERGKTVLMLGRVARINPFADSCERKQLKLPFAIECDKQSPRSAAPTERTNTVIREIAARHGAHYLDFTDMLCPNGRCDGFLEGQFIYFDPGHLSRAGSEILGHAASSREDVVRKLASFAGG